VTATTTTTTTAPATPAQSLLDVRTIYTEASVPEYVRGRAILARFPNAERIVVLSHWQIPDLHGNDALVEDWNMTKRTTLVLGVKKSLQLVPFERSADFVAPSQANGCAMACAYCYVARRKGAANPITTFVNIEGITSAILRHVNRQGWKFDATLADPTHWVYELGTNSDCAADALVSDNLRDLVALFRTLPTAKATFATKYVNRDLLTYDPQGKTRLRFSLMPPDLARILDVRTSPVGERIAAINDFVDAGYEVNVNFAPVIVYDGWQRDYADLFTLLDDALSPAAKAQMAAEIAFLTHNAELHAVNLRWHPQAESLLWHPELQEEKVSGTGGHNLRYRRTLKREWVAAFRALLTTHMPYCAIRYAF